MNHVDQIVTTFFLQNLAYCMAINRNPGNYRVHTIQESETLPIHQSALLRDFLIKPVINSSNVKHYTPIYLFLTNKNTTDALKDIFDDLSFNDIKDCFCYYRDWFQKVSANQKCVPSMNFFHLIGTLRLLKDRYDNPDIVEHIKYVLRMDNSNVPMVIKYSAVQIYAEIAFRNKSKIDKNAHKDYFLAIADIMKEIGSGATFSKFVATYSIYYYGISEKYADICDRRIRKIFENNEDGNNFLMNLHGKLPQVHAILRINVKQNTKSLKRVLSLYKILNSSDQSIEKARRTLQSLQSSLQE